MLCPHSDTTAAPLQLLMCHLINQTKADPRRLGHGPPLPKLRRPKLRRQAKGPSPLMRRPTSRQQTKL